MSLRPSLFGVTVAYFSRLQPRAFRRSCHSLAAPLSGFVAVVAADRHQASSPSLSALSGPPLLRLLQPFSGRFGCFSAVLGHSYRFVYRPATLTALSFPIRQSYPACFDVSVTAAHPSLSGPGLVGRYFSRWYVATAVRSSSRLNHRSDYSAHCGRCLAVLCPARLATSVPATFSHYDHSSIALRPLLYRCRWSSHRAFLVRLVPVCSGSWFGCCRIAPIFVHFLHTHCYFSYTRTSISPYLTL